MEESTVLWSRKPITIGEMELSDNHIERSVSIFDDEDGIAGLISGSLGSYTIQRITKRQYSLVLKYTDSLEIDTALDSKMFYEARAWFVLLTGICEDTATVLKENTRLLKIEAITPSQWMRKVVSLPNASRLATSSALL